ncbi:MiaB/RimO family radical SAM methylthiotransferase [Pseudodesulfovibrio tunisiensis]|uniref:MiaB/RimO family radical SAM methylthiotransferase n=1 Tax=Pseudodesulfovibrio tunisiensis TaxID=463192 RepID=UPI001FB1E0A4|nr:MiaB/RimO family radical SAM methylthiotransferase [Pseudodesulfovibrio tunisiensis]
MITFYTATLGCKINQYETRSIAEAWAGPGVDAVETEDALSADVILVNSCAVTANAVSDLRQTVRRLHRDNPGARIVVTGCAAQVLPEELADLPGVVRVVKQEEKGGLLAGPDAPLEPVKPGFAPFSISGYSRARAVVKVQDGCSHRCTYCIVPITRGPSVSRPVDEIVAEARRLFSTGFRELILSGVNLRHFGRDLDGKPDFWDLVARLENEFSPEYGGRARLRISSVEPGQLTDKALDVLSASRMVAPQLHISLQSGDRAVLRRMGRGHYDPAQALDFLKKLSEAWPVLGLGADLLVGFPGETDQEFENTMQFCRELPLTYGHVFPYSIRPGTAAARMDGQLEKAVKKERAARLRALVREKKKRFIKRLLDLPHLDVLMQDNEGQGVSEFYAACRLTEVPDWARPRDLVRVRPVGLDRTVILCEPLSREEQP